MGKERPAELKSETSDEDRLIKMEEQQGVEEGLLPDVQDTRAKQQTRHFVSYLQERGEEEAPRGSN